jgi:geranylgeranyl pyrophosphate synthase
MGLDEIGELQKEWRAIVLDKLTSVEQSQKEVKADIVEIKTTFVKQQALQELAENNRTDINELRNKVEQLETFKVKLIGIAIGAQAVIGVIIWLIEHGAK